MEGNFLPIGGLKSLTIEDLNDDLVLEDLGSFFCVEDFDQVEDVVIDQFLCSKTKYTDHLGGEDFNMSLLTD